MRCKCYDCENNEDGYCGCYDPIEIEADGSCDSVRIKCEGAEK